MNDDDFQRAYHDYMTGDQDAARREAASITLADGRHPVVVGLPFDEVTMYCLMLPEAAGLVGRIFPRVKVDDDA